MGYYEKDVYYQPEDFGLQVLGTLNDPEADYSFNMFVVWKHESGKIYYGSDSGCSCPSPFEDYTSLESLSEVTSIHDFIDDVKVYFNFAMPWSFDDDDDDEKATWDNDAGLDSSFQNLKADALELIQMVREA